MQNNVILLNNHVANDQATEQEDKRELLSTQAIQFNELVKRAEDIQKDCKDYIIKKVNPLNFTYTDDATVLFRADDGQTIETGLSRYALGQLGTKIGVPGNYIQKCVDNNKIALAKDNVNSWIKNYDGGFFLRQYNDHLRGVLTPRYSVCDAPQILNIMGNTLDMSQYNIKGQYLTEERMHLRFASTEMLNIDGEDLFPAIFLDSSDVGRSNLIVTFGIYKLICTNGMVIVRSSGVLYKQKHIGVDEKEFEEAIAASLKEIPYLTENAEQWVKAAKEKTIDKKKMEAIMKNMHLNDKAQAEVIDLMEYKYDKSEFGFINGVTEVAQQFTLEKRLEIERIAGGLLVA
jgi:hypothetical protein